MGGLLVKGIIQRCENSFADLTHNGGIVLHSDSLYPMATSTVPYKKPYPPKRSRKAPVLKQEVITRRLAKQNKSLISRELGISRNTVTAILEESNTDHLVESGRLQVAGLIPESIRVVKHRLEHNSETAAFKVLEGIGVLGSDTKAGRPPDASLTIAIQNLLIGNSAPATTTNSDSASQTDAPTDNSNVKPHQE